MKVIHVEKSPYPNENFKVSHWQVELSPSDLGLKEPTSQAELTDVGMRLATMAKYVCLSYLVFDGIISAAEMDHRMQAWYSQRSAQESKG